MVLARQNPPKSSRKCCGVLSPSQLVKAASRRRAAPGGQFWGRRKAGGCVCPQTFVASCGGDLGVCLVTDESLKRGFRLRQIAKSRSMLCPSNATPPFRHAHRGPLRPNPSLKRSTNGMPPGLGRGCGHIFHSPGLAASRRCPLSSNVRAQNTDHDVLPLQTVIEQSPNTKISRSAKT